MGCTSACRVQQKRRRPHLLLHMTKKLPDTEVLDRVKVHLAGYDLARWRQSMKFYGPENAA